MAVKTYAASVIGASHLRKDNPVCEDSSYYDKDGEIKDAIVLAVADGHGSDQCKYSSDGSKEAVKAFCTIVKQILEAENFSGDIKSFKATPGKDIAFAKKLSDLWQKRIAHVHSRKKRKDPPPQKKMSTLDMVYKKAEERDDWYWNVDYMLYGTTLLGIAVIGKDVLIYQIGDGDIVIVDDKGARNLIEGDHFLGVETYSLAYDKAWNFAKVAIITLDELYTKPCLIMLSSDGMANSYASEEDFYKTCTDYYNLIQEEGFEAVCKGMGDDKAGWLRETSDGGCGDDISLALAYFTPDEAEDAVEPEPQAQEESGEFKEIDFTKESK